MGSSVRVFAVLNAELLLKSISYNLGYAGRRLANNSFSLGLTNDSITVLVSFVG